MHVSANERGVSPVSGNPSMQVNEEWSSVTYDPNLRGERHE